MKQKHTKQQRKEVEKALEYLIAEGFVIKVGGEYRLKSDKEIAKELAEV
jgi:hypothetical protein